MNRKIELLAPGGDIQSIKAAIFAGADAVYCGLNKFNARNRAENITFEDLQGIIRLAHKHECEVFLTLNIVILDCEIPELIKLLNKLVNTQIDGVIIQDFGIFYLLTTYFPTLHIHASTQLTTHNEGQISFLQALGAERVNLSRELSISEICYLTTIAHSQDILTEVFVHGSYCISFSGACYMSSVHGGNSGNRGRCSQPCRDKYVPTEAGKEYPLNMKDNSAYFDVRELRDAGVDSLKIEGRIKEFEYVYTVVNAWRKQLNQLESTNTISTDNSDLYKVFNRDFSNAFLRGSIDKQMYIDNPMGYSKTYLSEMMKNTSEAESERMHKTFYDDKDEIRRFIKDEIDQYDTAKIPVQITVSGTCGAMLNVTIATPEQTFTVQSEVALSETGTEILSYNMIMKRLKAINETEYFIDSIDMQIDSELYIPFKELSFIKKHVLFILNGSKHLLPQGTLPALEKSKSKEKTTLSVLISSPDDIYLCNDPAITVYFQLPNNFSNGIEEYLEMFIRNKNLLPWFPAVLIGDDYREAVRLLLELQPHIIVSNNTGIAFEAKINGIEWIAGPSLNITNSFSLLGLKENMDCIGAFLSNEMSKEQIRTIKKPEGFKLFASIYHPAELMTSRQCLFHQVTGCEKLQLDGNCISKCEKQATITNLKGDTFYIRKTPGNYHNIYNGENMLNTDIVTDYEGLFTSVTIDLRDTQKLTNISSSKTDLISIFKNHINGNEEATKLLGSIIFPTMNKQYLQGI